jgi:hypothetical protein
MHATLIRAMNSPDEPVQSGFPLADLVDAVKVSAQHVLEFNR